MGIHGIYKEIGPGQRIALSKLAVDKFEETGRPLRIAIDVSIWLFQIQASKGGANPAIRTFYYRLLRMISNSIHPVFVFDGPNKPPFKRGKKTGANVSSVPDFLAKQLIKQFGFPIHYAPGEAEAECALLQREGIVDAVLSEDVDTLMFGSGICIRNWSPEPGTSGKTPTHVNLYDAVKTKSGAGLDREGMILIALMSGGDYVPEGIPGCGPKIACEAARAGFGKDLCKIRTSDKAALQEWSERLQQELKSNKSKFFRTKHPSLKIPEDFPRLDILGYYTHPIVSSPAALDNLRRSIKWDQDIDFPGLRTFTHDAFAWIQLEGAKHFIRNLAPPVLTRALRTRGAAEQFSDNPEALKEDEALWVKGIHGKRQHPVTDNSSELRVSYIPIDLVKIDLSKEDPDDVFSTQGLAAEGSDPDFVDIDDDEDEPRKRGPTKFDPTKPARHWVMETFVKIGVPVTVEDWEAGIRKPKRAATSKDKAAPKPKATRRTKTTSDVPQAFITQFAKVTKPGAQLSQRLSKAQKPAEPCPAASQSSKPAASRSVIELLSSSPVKPLSTAPTRPPRERSLSPVMELPSSVTKRRRRAPMQRSKTLPVSPSAPFGRPATPPPFHMSTVETLDLAISSPVRPSPSAGPIKKSRKVSTKNPLPRQNSVPISPSKTRQTTLEGWMTPSKLRNQSFRANEESMPAPPAPPAPPQFQMPTLESLDALDTLDMTMSSPPKPSLPARRRPTVPTNPRRTNPGNASPRTPLTSISSNTSFTSTPSTSSHASTVKPTTDSRIRRRPTRQTSAKSDLHLSTSVDLTGASSPPPQNPPPAFSSFTLPPPSLPPQHKPSLLPTTTSTTPPIIPNQALNLSPLRRSPRNHNHPISPWKQRRQKKSVIQLRKSIAGSFQLTAADASPEKNNLGAVGAVSGGAVEVLKGKARREFRMSQVEVLDLT